MKAHPFPWRKWVAALAILIFLIWFGVVFAVRWAGPGLRERLARELGRKFDAQAELQGLHISGFFTLKAEGEGLTLRRPELGSGAPFFAIQKFSAETNLPDILRWRPHIERVTLEGLQIHIPPRARTAGSSHKPQQSKLGFVIDELRADGARLERLPAVPGKAPLNFQIQHVVVRSVGLNNSMPFEAKLENPKPPGIIETSGTLGPWDREEPAATPVSGTYSFRHADLGVFRGIAGVLSSEGKYNGPLDRIQVEGTTATPDFELKPAGHPMNLATRFHAVVDGSTGDTELDPVDAQLGKTRLEVQGKIQGAPREGGKDVILDSVVDKGRLEDFLRLAVKTPQPPIVGAVSLKSKIQVPHGPEPIADKLRLDGSFSVFDAHFTSFNVESKLNSLSRRARGQPEAPEQGSVLSNFSGRFRLENGVMFFPALSFGVPGAMLQLTGTYGLKTEELDFHGTVSLEAKLSQTTTGIASTLLKLVDRLFEKKGSGAVIPIRITGTRSAPSFGLDFSRLK